MRGIFVFVLLLLLGHILSAQGLHYTHNHYNRVLFNPAEAGAFKGTYRLQSIVRDQNRSFFGTAYLSPTISVDSPFMWGFKKNHWVGGGLTLFRDNAGDAGLGSNGLLANLAYHIGLDKKLKRVITVGVRYGFISRFINDDNLSTETSINAMGPGATVSAQDLGEGNFSPDMIDANFGTLAVGLLFKTPLNKNTSLALGAAGSNLLGGTYGVLQSNNANEISQRINLHAQVSADINDRLTAAPTAFYSWQGGSQSVSIQANFAYHLNQVKAKNGRRGSRNADVQEEKDKIYLLPGIGFRYNDASALQFMMGMEYKKWRVSLGYDLAVSGYNNQTPHTAFEVALQRIFAIKKKPSVKPIIFCPRI